MFTAINWHKLSYYAEPLLIWKVREELFRKKVLVSMSDMSKIKTIQYKIPIGTNFIWKLSGTCEGVIFTQLFVIWLDYCHNFFHMGRGNNWLEKLIASCFRFWSQLPDQLVQDIYIFFKSYRFALSGSLEKLTCKKLFLLFFHKRSFIYRTRRFVVIFTIMIMKCKYEKIQYANIY